MLPNRSIHTWKQPYRSPTLRLARPTESALAPSRLITNAIEYPDGEPHLGHGYEKVIADISARYRRSRGETITLSLGLDEHSQKVVAAATRVGQTPKAYCDDLEGIYRRTWAALDLSEHTFIRTSSAEHRTVVESLLNRSYAKGDIYRGTYVRANCPQCPAEQKPHVKDGVCRLHNIPVATQEEPTYYFRLSKYLPQIREYIAAHPAFIEPENYRKSVLAQLDQDLRVGGQDISISRLVAPGEKPWGIPLPFAPEDPLARQSVTYVWFDALANYLTVAGYEKDPRRFAQFWPADLQVIGKDIARFHAVFWPGILLSNDLPLPRKISVHGFILDAGKKKLSKSDGSGNETFREALQYGSDPLRYYLARQVNPERDEIFTPERLKSVYTNDLVRRYGQTLPWVESLVEQLYQGVLPAGEPLPEDFELRALLDRYQKALDADDIHKGALQLLELINYTNRYLGPRASRTGFKPGYEGEAAIHLRSALEQIRLTAIAAWPFLPKTSEQILRRIGIDALPGSPDPRVSLDWQGTWLPERPLQRGLPLFPEANG